MTATRVAWGVGLVLVGGGLIYLLSPILTPFLVAALLAYIASPLLKRLEQWHLPRILGVIIVFLVLLLLLLVLLLVLIPQIQHQISAFIGKLPGYLDWLNSVLVPWLQTTLGMDVSVLDMAALKLQVTQHWQGLGGAVGQIFSYMTRSGMHLVAMLVNLALIPVVTFYLMRDWDGILARVPGLFPPRMRARLVTIARETDDVLAGFLRGQLSVMAALTCVYSIGLGIVGLELALAIGLLAGLVSFVPYLGFITGILVAGVAAMLQFHDPMTLLMVAAVFGVGQLLESLVLTPYLVGGRIGLHPAAVIFAVLAGGQLFGFFGILLALPVAAAIKVWLRHLYKGYQLSTFYQQPGKRARRP
jgi:predicted PurR-regulated permease PerM